VQVLRATDTCLMIRAAVLVSLQGEGCDRVAAVTPFLLTDLQPFRDPGRRTVTMLVPGRTEPIVLASPLRENARRFLQRQKLL